MGKATKAERWVLNQLPLFELPAADRKRMADKPTDKPTESRRSPSSHLAEGLMVPLTELYLWAILGLNQ